MKGFMNAVFLSIVIPAYNSEKSIENLLISIRNSHAVDFKDTEVIIVDDHSADKTKKIVAGFISQAPFPITLITLRSNQGPAAARNKGSSFAKGRYLLFLDSDVELKKNTLQKILRLFKNNTIKAFTGIWDWKQRTDAFFPQFKAFRDWSYWLFERERNSRYYLFSTRIAGINKKLFWKLGGFDKRFSQLEDFDLTYRIEKVAPINFCPYITVHHEFENFWPVVKKYFMRSAVWAQLYLKRYRFDPVATSSKEASKGIIAFFVLFFLFIGIFFHPLFLAAILLFCIYGYLERQFWMFLLKKRGPVFLLKSIPTSIFLYIIIILGAVWGFTLYIVKSIHL